MTSEAQRFDPAKETPLEYNRRCYPKLMARLEALRDRILSAPEHSNSTGDDHG
jgi:hypothetical protein